MCTFVSDLKVSSTCLIPQLKNKCWRYFAFIHPKSAEMASAHHTYVEASCRGLPLTFAGSKRGGFAKAERVDFDLLCLRKRL